MLNRIRTAQKSNEGFTLIELLIVIVVLGILAGIVVFGVSTFKSDATQSAACTNYKQVVVASEAYKAKTGGPASAIDDATHSSTTLVGAGYLKSAPVPAVGYTAATGEATNPGGCA